ncbi:hypothetical protein SLEP1_g16010 [Rubroshorea leprosula]|uniref:Uncharacterized protein n=1 Tax=Rubroshorea leprosula TaxID=152421 RepID=A0AAV5IVF5_9ROSI|nr:hypothetical protein SLEP1_g16010 [Rubroshorea leprosula]
MSTPCLYRNRTREACRCWITVSLKCMPFKRLAKLRHIPSRIIYQCGQLLALFNQLLKYIVLRDVLSFKR